MNILVVEDQPKKSDEITALLREIEPTASVTERRSYQSGLKEILVNTPELVLLDMSMPNFDRSSTEPGWRTRAFAGRDILREMKRKGLFAKVIVVTQFESFGDPPHQQTLTELKGELANEFPGIYLGTVYYHPAQSDWKRNLTSLVRHSLLERGEP